MSIKKLSLAAAISIGLLAFGSTAFADEQTTTQTTTTQTTQETITTQSSQDLSSASSSCSPNAIGATKDIERQVYAYPSISDRNIVFPTNDQIIQVGANDQQLPKNQNITGAAAPLGSDSGMATIIQDRQGVSLSRGLKEGNAGVANNLNIQTASSTPMTKMVQVQVPITGAAAPLPNQFPDVPLDYWAKNDINRLASSGTVVGYPDRNYKPYVPISRSEFASMLVNGLNMEEDKNITAKIFKDVPESHWANSVINTASNKGLMVGYTDRNFKPYSPVSRAEALNILGKNVPGQLSLSEAMNVLNAYSDGKDVPAWAKLNVAQALNAGINKDLPDNNMILPSKDTTRAEAASMMLKLRQTLALEPSVTGAATQIQQTTVQLPTMKIKFNGILNARTSKIGDHFTATTLEPLSINGINYPSGSKVSGKIVEIIRPSINAKGAMKIELNNIANGNNSSILPREIISVKMDATKNQNIVSRILTFPFTATGKVVGTIGRTLGGGLVVAGNSTEHLISGVGQGVGEVASGKFSEAGRSSLDGVVGFGRGIYDFGATGVSGVVGLLGDSAQEIGYVISPQGTTITSINPGDSASVAFGCGE